MTEIAAARNSTPRMMRSVMRRLAKKESEMTNCSKDRRSVGWGAAKSKSPFARK
jgi:hypothetical protein